MDAGSKMDGAWRRRRRPVKKKENRVYPATLMKAHISEWEEAPQRERPGAQHTARRSAASSTW